MWVIQTGLTSEVSTAAPLDQKLALLRFGLQTLSAFNFNL